MYNEFDEEEDFEADLSEIAEDCGLDPVTKVCAYRGDVDCEVFCPLNPYHHPELYRQRSPLVKIYPLTNASLTLTHVGDSIIVAAYPDDPNKAIRLSTAAAVELRDTLSIVLALSQPEQP